ELHVCDWLFWQTTRGEHAPRVYDPHVLNRDVAKLAEATFRWRDRCAQSDPVGWDICCALRDSCVAVTRIPVQREREGKRHVLHPRVADQYVFDKAAPCLSGLEANAFIGADAGVVVGDDVANA